MIDDEMFHEAEALEHYLLNGTIVKIFKKCPCAHVADDVFHDFFRKIDWTDSHLKYLNRVNNKWTIYC